MNETDSLTDPDYTNYIKINITRPIIYIFDHINIYEFFYFNKIIIFGIKLRNYTKRNETNELKFIFFRSIVLNLRLYVVYFINI